MTILSNLKYKVFINLVVLSFLICSTISAQKIASFDPYFLILFHPLMSDFDQSIHRFLKQNNSSLSKSEWNIQREKLLRELRNQKQTLKNKSTVDFYSKLAGLKKRFPNQEDYHKQYKKLRAEYLGIGQESELQSEYSKFYYNDQESLEIFSRIWRDIRVVMAQLQQQNEYLFYLPIYKDEPHVIKKPYNLKLSANNIGVSEYLNFTLKSPQIKGENQVENHLLDYFDKVGQIKELLYPHLKSKFVLYGLEDVSAILLQKILLKNQITNEITDIIGNVYKMWLQKRRSTDKEIE